MMKNEVKRYPVIGKYMSNRGIFYVNRSDPDPETIEESMNYLRAGLLLDMNPEGTSKNRGPRLGDLRTGVAVMAVKLAREGIDCPIIPIGMSDEHPWLRIKRRIPMVVGAPFWPVLEGRRPGRAIRETHERLESNLQFVFDLANAIK